MSSIALRARAVTVPQVKRKSLWERVFARESCS